LDPGAGFFNFEYPPDKYATSAPPKIPKLNADRSGGVVANVEYLHSIHAFVEKS
jgi:hypothetical protein